MTEATPLLRIGEAADILGVHVETIRRWERDGKITSVRIPPPDGQRRFRREDVERLANGQRAAS